MRRLVLCVPAQVVWAAGELLEWNAEETVTQQVYSANANTDLVVTDPEVLLLTNQNVGSAGQWTLEKDDNVYNSTGNLMYAGITSSQTSMTFQIFIPESGEYYVFGRAKTSKGGGLDTGINRTFWVSFTQNGQERYLQGRDPINVSDDNQFDSVESDGVYKYLFGSRWDYVNSFGLYSYTDAKPIYLSRGEATVTVYGNTYGRMDYLGISKTLPPSIQTKEAYNQYLKRYEDSQAPRWDETVTKTDVDHEIVSFEFKAIDDVGIAYYQLYKRVGNGSDGFACYGSGRYEFWKPKQGVCRCAC